MIGVNHKYKVGDIIRIETREKKVFIGCIFKIVKAKGYNELWCYWNDGDNNSYINDNYDGGLRLATEEDIEEWFIDEL